MTRIGSLCTGYGGLDMAAEALTDGTVAWVSEIAADACQVITARMPHTPNLGDLTAVDWAAVEPVDVLTAGYPCQPFSTAGRRQGADDPRHIWPHVLRAIRDLRPRLVLLENVAGHLSLGFGRVLGDLAAAGLDAEWTVLRASDVGACHRRARLFIVAWPADAVRSGWKRRDVLGRRFDVSSARAAADADNGRRQGRAEQHGEPCAGRVAERVDRGHAVRCGVEVVAPDFGPYAAAVDRWAAILGRPAPASLDGGKLNARFVEWMMGLPDGWVCDVLPRRKALHVLGNGVVPQQALAAFRAIVP